MKSDLNIFEKIIYLIIIAVYLAITLPILGVMFIIWINIVIGIRS